MRFILCVLSLVSLISFGQNGYDLVGDAFGVPAIGAVCGDVDSCFTLTPNEFNKYGGVWDQKKINLNHSFDASFCMTMGSNDQWGADGFAFVMRGASSANFGQLGGGLGYQDINPSIAIEFDTWDNASPYDDIPDDHTGLYLNSNYVSPLVSAVPLYPNSQNIEDGSYHVARVVWNAEKDSLLMYFDGFLRLQWQGDLVNNVFGGQNEIIWGFTASTGGASNLQQICFPKYKINLDDETICAGDSVQLHFYDKNMTSYRWVGPDGNNIKNWNTLDFNTPFVLADSAFYTGTAGTYHLFIEINNQALNDSLQVTVNPLPVKTLAESERTLCPATESSILAPIDSSYMFLWSNGETTASVMALQEGLYTVLMTDSITGCQQSDSITIHFLCDPVVVAPNVFTPNGDLQNDQYTLILKYGYAWISEFEFKIYNRWGQLMYSALNEPVLWDGKFEGKEASAGTYFYTYNFKHEKTGEPYSGQGFIQLSR